MIEYIIFAVTVIVSLILSVFYLWPGTKRNTTIPGPDISDELEGNYPEITASGSLHEFLSDLHSIYGTITFFWLGPVFCVSIASPEILKKQANVFDRPKELFELFEPLITPNSIQYANGGEGRRRHAAYSKCFTYEAIRVYMDLFVKYAKDMSKKFEGLSQEDHIPLGQYMFAFAIRTMLASSFGNLFLSDKEVLEFKHSYDLVWGTMENALAGKKMDANKEAQFDKCKEKLFGMLLKAAEASKKNKRSDGHERFVDVVQEVNDSKEIIKADLMTVAVGGVHTTAFLLTWCIYFLATHKEVQDKVYDEIIEVLGDETIVIEAVDKLVYMRQVLDETLRCSTLAPISARVSNFDIELAGHQIPAGTPVVQAQGVILQDESIWPDPEIFDPERFNEVNRKKIPTHAFEPFGFAGKRKCPGYRFSYVEAHVLLTELVRKFQFDLIEGQVVQKVYGLVTKPADEIWIKLDKRK